MLRHASFLLAILLAMASFTSIAGAPAPGPNAAASQADCVAKGMAPDWRRAGSDSARVMVQACLVESPRSADLCDKVPPENTVDVLSSEAWLTKGCSAFGVTNSRCHALMDEVAAYCYAGGNTTS